MVEQPEAAASPEAGLSGPGAARLEELRRRLDDLDDVPLQQRVELFEELDELLGRQLDALEDQVE